jgi:hypothetical protein
MCYLWTICEYMIEKTYTYTNYIYNTIFNYDTYIYPVYLMSYYVFDLKRIIYKQINNVNPFVNDNITITNICIEHIQNIKHITSPTDKYVIWGNRTSIPDDIYKFYNEYNNLLTITYKKCIIIDKTR